MNLSLNDIETIFYLIPFLVFVFGLLIVAIIAEKKGEKSFNNISPYILYVALLCGFFFSITSYSIYSYLQYLPEVLTI